MKKLIVARKKQTGTVAVLALLVLIFSWQHALEASSDTETMILTLPDAISIALRQSPEITAAKQGLELAMSRLRESQGNTGPKISIQASGQGTLIPLSKEVSTSSAGSSMTVTASQSLQGVMAKPFSVGLSPQELSEISLQEAELDFAKTEQKVVLDTISAYLNVIKAQQLRDLTGVNIEKTERLLEEVETKLDLGLATQLDLMRTQNQLDQAKFNLMKAEDSLASAKRSFALMLGFPPETEFRLTDPSEVLEALQIKVDKYDEYELDKLVAIALESRIEMIQADLSCLKAEASIETVKRSLKPSVNLYANYSHQDVSSFSASASLNLSTGDAGWNMSLSSRGSSGQSPDRDFSQGATSLQNSVGFNVAFSLWDGGVAEEKLKQAELSLKAQEIARDRQRQAIIEEVYQASTTVKHARINLELARKTVLEAKDFLEVTEARFEMGVAVVTEVIDAAQSLSQAESGVVDALFDYYLAQARLEKAIGLLGTEGWTK
ncbi:MAG: TolC family protein [Bacillota bacterium]